jgi:release factor glutamine methyltransferase
MRGGRYTMTLREALADAAARLAAAGLDEPRREARCLAAHLLGTRPGILLDPDATIDAERFEDLVARRAAREPFAFIAGRQGFWTLDVAVSPDTLIPRADSEAVIEAALALIPDRGTVGRILDLGTGTGCLLLAALAEFPAAFGVGVDLAPRAARLAAGNAAALGFAGRAAFVAGDWGAALSETFDLVLCNPPYIPSAEIAALMPEVARYEPHCALDGGHDGLAEYRRLLPMLRRLLAPEGVGVLEIGQGQAASVAPLAAAAGLHFMGVDADLAGIPRAVKLCRDMDARLFAKKPFGSTAVGS